MMQWFDFSSFHTLRMTNSSEVHAISTGRYFLDGTVARTADLKRLRAMLSFIRSALPLIRVQKQLSDSSLRLVHNGKLACRLNTNRFLPLAPLPMIAPTPVISEVTLPTTSHLKLSLIGDFLIKRQILAPTLNKSAPMKTPESPSHSLPGPMLAKKKLIKPFRRKAMNMLRIRHRKMKKHQRRKRARKYATKIKTIALRKEISREKLFRAELLADIRKAEQFNPEAYVKQVLTTIASKPKQESLWERRRRYERLSRIHRSNVSVIRPEFDDPVP